MKEKTDDLVVIITKKIEYYKTLINKTIVYVKTYKSYNILSTNDLNVCYKSIEEINTILNSINVNKNESAFEKLQIVNDIYSNIFKKYGTQCLDDVLNVCVGNQYVNSISNEKYLLLNQYFHPISYKNLKWRNNTNSSENNDKKIILQKNKIVEDFMIVENSQTLDCFDLARTSNNFYVKTMGIKICFQCKQKKWTLIVSGIVNLVHIPSIINEYVRTATTKISSATSR